MQWTSGFFPLRSTDSFASKTKIIPLNRKHSQLYHSGGFPFLAQLLINVLLWFRFKSDRRLGQFRIFIEKPAYWQQHGQRRLLIDIAKAVSQEGKQTPNIADHFVKKSFALRFWPIFDVMSFINYIPNFKTNQIRGLSFHASFSLHPFKSTCQIIFTA